MRFKTDENLRASAVALLRAAGHDVHMVLDEALGGAADQEIVALCGREGRAFVTLDVGLADIRAYPPAKQAGVIVLRTPDQRVETLTAVIRRVIRLLGTEPLTGALWLVDTRRVRIRR